MSWNGEGQIGPKTRPVLQRDSACSLVRRRSYPVLVAARRWERALNPLSSPREGAETLGQEGWRGRFMLRPEVFEMGGRPFCPGGRRGERVLEPRASRVARSPAGVPRDCR